MNFRDQASRSSDGHKRQEHEGGTEQDGGYRVVVCMRPVHRRGPRGDTGVVSPLGVELALPPTVHLTGSGGIHARDYG